MSDWATISASSLSTTSSPIVSPVKPPVDTPHRSSKHRPRPHLSRPEVSELAVPAVSKLPLSTVQAGATKPSIDGETSITSRADVDIDRTSQVFEAYWRERQRLIIHLEKRHDKFQRRLAEETQKAKAYRNAAKALAESQSRLSSPTALVRSRTAITGQQVREGNTRKKRVQKGKATQNAGIAQKPDATGKPVHKSN